MATVATHRSGPPEQASATVLRALTVTLSCQMTVPRQSKASHLSVIHSPKRLKKLNPRS